MMAEHQPPDKIPQQHTNETHGADINTRVEGRSLRRELDWYHVVFICVSATVGAGLYVRSGVILQLAGAGAVGIVFFLMGLLAIAVMRTIGEMILIWPIPNALVEFVRVFVDEELSIVVAGAYWLTNSIGFAALLSAAAFGANTWTHASPIEGTLFLLAPAIVILIATCLRVKWYGWIEVVGGVLKLLFITVVIISTIVIVARQGMIEPGGISQNYRNTTSFLTNNVTEAANEPIAIIMALPVAAYAYIGIEAPAVLALEIILDPARAPNRSQRPGPANRTLYFSVKWLPVLFLLLYVLAGMLATANISPQNPQLPNTQLSSSGSANDTGSSSIFVIVAESSGHPQLATAFTVFLILTTWSGALSTLYLSSRTLFAATSDLQVNEDGWQDWKDIVGWTLSRSKWLLSFCGQATRGSAVPCTALMISALAFIWLPIVYVVRGESAAALVNILAEMASVCCVFVWACQCLAYIRFLRYLEKHKEEIVESHNSDMDPIRRWDASELSLYPWCAWGQPGVAYAALGGCIFILIVGSGSALWRGWDTRQTTFVADYVPLLAFASAWLVLKMYRKGFRYPENDREWRKGQTKEDLANEESLWFGWPLSNWEQGFKKGIDDLNNRRNKRRRDEE